MYHVVLWSTQSTTQKQAILLKVFVLFLGDKPFFYDKHIPFFTFGLKITVYMLAYMLAYILSLSLSLSLYIYIYIYKIWNNEVLCMGGMGPDRKFPS